MRISSTGLLIGLWCLSHSLSAAEWQWSVKVDQYISSETATHPEAFLWIPPGCTRVRGIVVGHHNMLEEGILEHPEFRAQMAESDLAELWITPGLDPLWADDGLSQLALDSSLQQLARKSGYTELARVPVIPIGHSAYASFPWNYAAMNPDRTLAILSIKGDAPATHLTGCGRKNRDWSGTHIDGIPGLMVMGEYEWWEDRLKPAIEFIKSNPGSCISVLADAGQGHFDYTDKLVRYLALYIGKVAKYRLPAQWRLTEKPVLKMMKPSRGWLAERWWKDGRVRNQPASYRSYKGERSEAFWYPDREMAEATERYCTSQGGKQQQYIGFIREGRLAQFSKTQHAQYILPWLPDEDGITFRLQACVVDSTHTTQLSQVRTPVIDRICGPVEKLNDSTFRLQFYRMGLTNPKRTGDIWIMGHDPGDLTTKSSVQQATIRVPLRNTTGKVQTITFDTLPDVHQATKSVSLHADSDAGLPVSFYIKEGPVTLSGNKLVLTPIPPRAAFPVKVTVVAWQYGIKGKVQTASPVTREFYIHR